jgi:ferritin-like metal-binding protein YciE
MKQLLKGKIMAIQNPKDLFVTLLSDVRHHEDRTTNFLKEASAHVKDQDIKEALESRVFLKDQTLSSLDRCFDLIGEQPKKLSGKFQEVFVDDFKKELSEIKSPIAKHLFIIAKVNHLMHLRIGEYVALIAMADITGHYGVGSLLENCLADKLAFVERARRLVRNLIESEMAVGAS